jgi:amino-acid N-acetyltransferase
VLLMGATTTGVRVARARDDAPARALLERAGLPLDGYEQSWRRWVASDRNGDLVGVVALERHGTPPVYLLRSLAVAPGQRGTGLGAALVRAALAAADAHEQCRAGVGLLTTTAAGYFDRFGFTVTERAGLPAALSASAELTGACPATAAAYWRA